MARALTLPGALALLMHPPEQTCGQAGQASFTTFNDRSNHDTA